VYRKNQRTQQPFLVSDVNGLPARSLDRLHKSWATCFREEVFARIDEDLFAVLYSERASRPNVPVNVLVGLEILKGGKDWTDEEMYEHFLFDLQVRYALGCDNFGEDDFDLRTVYYFRQRLAEYAVRAGQNLMATLFAQITDAQMAKIGLKTDQQRLDSTMLLSNIADLSRLELLLEVLQRLWRILSAADQERYAEVFQPFVKGSAGQYTYRLKGQAAVWAHIAKVGEVLQHLLGELAEGYGSEPVYAVAERFFAENFVLEDKDLRAKQNREIGAGCLQSLDDVEATYRRKASRTYKGYVANIAETCHPDNPVQLIDQVQIAPNRVSDVQLLKEGLAELKSRTGVETAVTDGGYVSPEVDAVLREHGVQQITTGLTGTLPDHRGGMLALSDFDMPLDATGEVRQVTCPAGHSAELWRNASGMSYRFSFRADTCRACPFFVLAQCPVKSNRRQTYCELKVPKARAQSAQRRRLFAQHKEEARNLRTAVEATVFQLKHKWAKGKLRVRGLWRVTTTVICAALSVNLRRIDRYHNHKLRGKLTAQPRPRMAGLVAAGG
jgi:hypothetical protein